MAAFVKWLLSPCLFGHQPLVYERVNGELALVCPRCRQGHVVRLVLS